MANIPRGAPDASALSPHVVSIEGVPVDFNGDGTPRIRDHDLAVKLGYTRPRKIRDLIRQLIQQGGLQDVRMRPAAGRIELRPGVARPATGDEYWLTEEQALFVSARSGTHIATELLKSVIQVFVLARRGQLRSAPGELPQAPQHAAREPPEPPEPPELAAAAELLGGMDPRVRAALRKLPRPRRPSVEHWLDQARELGHLVERSDVPIPLDPLACARLASSLILATGSVPDHPLVLGSREDLRRTLATIDRLLSRAADDPELRDRVADLRGRWSTEASRLHV